MRDSKDSEVGCKVLPSLVAPECCFGDQNRNRLPSKVLLKSKWVWVKIKPAGIGRQVLVHVSIYQGKPFWVHIFDPQPYTPS